MIKEAYCSFEVCKLLREKGFDEPCRSYFTDGTDYCYCTYDCDERTDINLGVFEYLRPTHQMAMAWLREVHHIFIEIGTSIDLNGKYHFRYAIFDKECEYVRKGYTNLDWKYEDAVEAALKYCLDHLI